MPNGRVEYDIYCIREANQRKDGCLNVNLVVEVFIDVDEGKWGPP